MTASVVTPATPSIASLNNSRRQANRTRATHLVAVADGELTPVQFVQKAATAEGRPLQKTTVYQLLLNQPNWGRGRARETVKKIASVCRAANDTRAITVGWLLDPRAHGSRVQAFLDAISTKGSAPWPGYPFQRGTYFE